MDEEDNNIDESYGEVDEIVTESKPKRKRTPSTKNTRTLQDTKSKH